MNQKSSESIDNDDNLMLTREQLSKLLFFRLKLGGYYFVFRFETDAKAIVLSSSEHSEIADEILNEYRKNFVETEKWKDIVNLILK